MSAATSIPTLPVRAQVCSASVKLAP
jgi:hypothetical protein